MKAQIKTRISLKAVEEGGRKMPIVKMPHRCIFVIPEGNFDCGIIFENLLNANGRVETPAEVGFLRPDLVMPYIRPGTRFQLREMRVIGEGTVERIDEK